MTRVRTFLTPSLPPHPLKTPPPPKEKTYESLKVSNETWTFAESAAAVIPVTSMSILLHHCNIVFAIPTYPFNLNETTDLITELLQKQSKGPKPVKCFKHCCWSLWMKIFFMPWNKHACTLILTDDFAIFSPSVYICKISVSCFSFPNDDRTNLKAILFRVGSPL